MPMYTNVLTRCESEVAHRVGNSVDALGIILEFFVGFTATKRTKFVRLHIMEECLHQALDSYLAR